jgi:chitin synthase
MDSPYHQRPLSQTEDESDDEAGPFAGGMDPNASTDRIPLTQGYRPPNPPYSASPPYGDRPPSRYTLSESYVPGAQAPPAGGFGPGTLNFPDPTGGRPVSVISNSSEDWIQRQQPVQASQADLRRYQTRRVKLNQGNVFSADYPYFFSNWPS